MEESVGSDQRVELVDLRDSVMEEMNWAKSTRNSAAYSRGRWVGEYYTSGFTGCVLQEDAFELNE